MIPIDINEFLNADNRWVNRLLGIDQFHVRRDMQKIETEYNQDKWGALAKLNLSTPEEAKAKELEIISGVKPEDEAVISFGTSLFRANSRLVQTIYDSVLRDLLSRYHSPLFCELGAGYGYNLSLVPSAGYGGEYSSNGIELGKRLGFDLHAFDFYETASYQLIRDGSTVFTVQALEQVPDASCFIEGIWSVRDRVRFVVHLEPSMIPTRTDLLGILRNRYQEINDYNRNLYTLVTTDPRIEVLELKPDTIGSSPLNSLHSIAWRFRS